MKTHGTDSFASPINKDHVYDDESNVGEGPFSFFVFLNCVHTLSGRSMFLKIHKHVQNPKLQQSRAKEINPKSSPIIAKASSI